MKHTRLALALVATSLAATPAVAASLTMVQFGSFETRAEAEKRLAEISKKYDAVVGKLASNIREVKLPPDNLTVYRTQAGPVENRSAAQSICSQLANGGDECYIVQTAATAAVAEAKPVEAKTETASVAPAPDLTSKLSTLKEDAPREVPNMPSLATTPAEPSPQMHAALDKAVAEQPVVAAAVTNDTKEATSSASLPKRDFWTRVNPFAGGTSAKPVPEAAPAVVASVTAPAAELAAPVETVQTVAPVPVVKPEPLTKLVEAPTPVVALPKIESPVITQAEPLRLPPPPAPLKAQEHPALAAKLNKPEPTATGVLVAPTPASGSVQVEEAKRVPLSSAMLPPAAVAVAPVAVAPAVVPAMIQPAVSLRPSATDGQKTLWAQVGPFEDGDAALSFWANYRQTHPDFPVVRVRVTTPYMQQVRGSSQTWLRVGPVMQAAFVKNLCGSLAPKEGEKATVRCGVVTDLASSVQPKRGAGFLPPSRYAR